jgi:ATP-dependent RNA helicase DDX3X
MTNGLVNGTTGMESQFGASPLLFHSARHSPSPSEALGIGRSAYVPPHLRNVQRAASNPSLSEVYVPPHISLPHLP